VASRTLDTSNAAATPLPLYGAYCVRIKSMLENAGG
jgi:hypothetical protein